MMKVSTSPKKPSWYTPTYHPDVRGLLTSLIPKGEYTSTACWRRCVGYFVYNNERVFLRAVLAYSPETILGDDRWVARPQTHRVWDWGKSGPLEFLDEKMLEYTFSEEHEFSFRRVRLYHYWLSPEDAFIHDLGKKGHRK